MNAQEMKQRLKQFALRAVKLADSFPTGRLGDVIGKQLMRSATSVAANYRATCMARTKREFVHKLGIVEEEADESIFWIEFSTDAGLVKSPLVEALLKEAQEILKIIISSRKTARKNMKRPDCKLGTKPVEPARTAINGQ
jgi:four helix bundle protein